jgi:hypothetical protein
MKRLLVALVLVLMTSGTALAHGGFRFGINLGIPLFYPFYGYPYYSYPAYGHPVYSYPVTHYRYYESSPTYQGEQPRKVIENIYVNGQLVERRIKIYDELPADDANRDYER